MTTRREFLVTSAAGSGALMVGFLWQTDAPITTTPEFKPNAWLKILKDGRAVLTVGKSEMGQGVRTTLPMILADELELDWTKVELEQAMPGPDFRALGTGGSTSTTTLWKPLRLAAAAAREMLIGAAAARWSVEPGNCRAEKGFVVNPSTGRKLAYGALASDAAKLPVPKDPPLKKPSEFRLVGRPTKRLDGPALVRGTAVFAMDHVVPGMKVAVVARCPVAGGRARTSNADAVKAMPGVVAIVAVPRGLAVVAERTDQALKARRALQVDWELGPHAAFDSDAFRQRLTAALDQPGEKARAEGDAIKALAEAGQRLEAVYEFPFQAHAPLEPPTCVAHATAEGCELWVGSQSPNTVQDRVAKALGLKPEQVKVHVLLLGGGFGRRLAWDYPVEAAEVSRAAKVPVKLLFTREDDLAHDWFHPMSLQRLEAALNAKGVPTAWRHRVAAPSILLSWAGGKRSAGIVGSETNGAQDTPYRVPNLLVEYHEVPLHLPLGWWRAIQAVPNTFARECFVDEVAKAAGKDPLAFRLELLAGDDPEKKRLAGVLKAVGEKAKWGRAAKGRFQGLACAVFHGTCVAEVAEVSLDPSGKPKVEKVTVVVDMGRVVNPLNAEAQVESSVVWGLSALRTGITFKAGRVQQANFSDFPVLSLEQMPEIVAHFLPSEEAPLGLGEPPVLPAIPAVLNAMAAATGKRLRRLPLLPSEIV